MRKVWQRKNKLSSRRQARGRHGQEIGEHKKEEKQEEERQEI
jgi:hypothetical protein